MKLAKSDIGKKVWLKEVPEEDLPREKAEILDVNPDNDVVMYDLIESLGIGECSMDMVECYVHLPNTPAVALFTLSQTKMRNFTEDDWRAWSGCNSETPMIGEIKIEDEEVAVILDGNQLDFYDEDGNFVTFELSKFAEG